MTGRTKSTRASLPSTTGLPAGSLLLVSHLTAGSPERHLPTAEKLEPGELNSMFKLLKINRHLAKMSVYSVVLRGIKTKEDLTPERMRYVGLSGEFNVRPAFFMQRLKDSRGSPRKLSAVLFRVPGSSDSIPRRVSLGSIHTLHRAWIM